MLSSCGKIRSGWRRYAHPGTCSGAKKRPEHMNIGVAARGGGLRGIVYSDRPVERSIGRGKKGKMICSQIEARIFFFSF